MCTITKLQNLSRHGGFVSRHCVQNISESLRILKRLRSPLSYAPGCCFIIKTGDAGSEACSQSPLEQAGPFLSARECPVLWVFVLADASPCQASSSFFYPSFYRPHSLSSLPGSHLPSPTRDPSSQAAHLQRGADRNVKAAGVWLAGHARVLRQICVLLRSFQAASWNYLGAKLIAPDPASRCNRLTANLGFSQCSQGSSGWRCCTELSTALFFQGFDPWHGLSCSSLPHTLVLYYHSLLIHH